MYTVSLYSRGSQFLDFQFLTTEIVVGVREGGNGGEEKRGKEEY
jgi:hypothetical protein